MRIGRWVGSQVCYGSEVRESHCKVYRFKKAVWELSSREFMLCTGATSSI